MAQLAGVSIGTDGDLQHTKLFSDSIDDSSSAHCEDEELGTATMDISASYHK